MTERRLGISELEARLAVDRSTISDWCRKGKLPAPHYIGEARKWWLHDIEAWERAQMDPARPRRRRCLQ